MWRSGQLRIVLLMALALSVWCFVASATARADWVQRTLDGLGETFGVRGFGLSDDWQDTIAEVGRIPKTVAKGTVAARVSGEGHWTFVNSTGERFTAANRKEMTRVGSVLFPGGTGPNGLTVYLTPRAVFVNRDQLKALPAGARLRLVIGGRSYPLLARKGNDDGAAPRLVAALRRDVLVPLTNRAEFEEVQWQLERPLMQARYRILSLVSDGPAALGVRANRGKSGSNILAERIDPDHLTSSLPALAGQTAMLTGRIEHDKLVIRNSSGSETSVDLAGVLRVAAAHDVGLAILNSRAPRQPGERNWLWQTVDVDGLAQALQRRTVADFLGSLALAGDKLEVRAVASGGGRVRLDVVAVSDGLLSTTAESIVALIAELASEVVGTVVTSTVQLDLVAASRVRELARRVVPGVPSVIQASVLGLAVLGLMSMPVVLGWWRAVWPAEVRSDYGDGAGYVSARFIRLLAFFVLFLPLASVPALVWRTARALGCAGLAVARSNRGGGDGSATKKV